MAMMNKCAFRCSSNLLPNVLVDLSYVLFITAQPIAHYTSILYHFRAAFIPYPLEWPGCSQVLCCLWNICGCFTYHRC